MALEHILIEPSVQWFLNDPVDGLTRSLSDPLFEILKNRTDAAAFEETGKRLVHSAFISYFKEGYMRWVELAILSSLDPDKSYRVPAVDAIADPLMGEGHENPGERVANAPEAERVNSLSFQQHPIVSYVVAKIMVWSVRLGRFVAMHSEFVEPYWTAREVTRNAEWLDFTQLKIANGLARIRPDQKIPPDLSNILPDIEIYLADDLSDIKLIADHSRILRPDVSVEVMEDADWFEKGRLSSIRRHHAVIKPRFGTFILCRVQPSQAALDELMPKPAVPAQTPATSEAPVTGGMTAGIPEQPAPAPVPELCPDIHILEIGYDQGRLEPLLESLNKLNKQA
jgi:hypothetical protein